MNPGLHRGLSNEAYHAGPGLSCSQVKRLKRSPWHMHALTLPGGPPPKAPTPQMFAGTLAHCALLEPAEFHNRYAIGPNVNKLTKEWKAFRERTEADGMEIIDQQQHDVAHAQAAALKALPEVAELMADGEAEVSAYWEDHETQGPPVLCKCRPDWVARVGQGAGVILLDVKTAADASPEGFRKAVAAFEYHRQAHWYTTGFAQASGLEVLGFVFCVVESEYPYASACYMLSDEALRIAEKENREAVQLFRRCRAEARWPGYPAGVTVLDLPGWYR